jgi:hypothetical protein
MEFLGMKGLEDKSASGGCCGWGFVRRFREQEREGTKIVVIIVSTVTHLTPLMLCIPCFRICLHVSYQWIHFSPEVSYRKAVSKNSLSRSLFLKALR